MVYLFIILFMGSSILASLITFFMEPGLKFRSDPLRFLLYWFLWIYGIPGYLWALLTYFIIWISTRKPPE